VSNASGSDVQEADYNRHENMAAQMGVGGVPFVKLHEGPISALQRQFGEYIKDLHQQRNQPVLVPVVPVVESTKKSIAMINGFPVVPDIRFSDAKKEELEDLMRDYLGKHYRKLSSFNKCSPELPELHRACV
jgi:hypothetical protein